MGFTGLARWVNAPVHGSLSIISSNILENYNGKVVGNWNITIKAFRLPMPPFRDMPVPDRIMCTLQMNDSVFVLVEDSVSPERATVVDPANSGDTFLQSCTHYRTTLVTVRPPMALEQLISQLKSRWVPARQSTSGAAQRNQAMSSQQLTIEGMVFAIGTDWLVRVGNVMLSTREMKGLIIEAEYLPVGRLHSPTVDGTSELLSNMLTALLPPRPDAKTLAVTSNDSQWAGVLSVREDDEAARQQPVKESDVPVDDEDDIYAYGDDPPPPTKGDWFGIDRDRRSAYLVMGGLRSEGLL
ncbi:Mediator of RNA polymerase II transcription subunit 20 [Pleurotus pulmonarius]|nr:hypothetical protein EYR36_006412 [Pleurotus pulmonarius]KAF4601113.1 hypothetical protein EYR38_005763 [Pleurotus pulmonarius]